MSKNLLRLMMIGAALLVPGTAMADSLETIFADANSAYFQGDYDEASAGYRRLEELGVVDADVSFNLATSEAHRGAYGSAIQQFERTLWLRPGDEGAQAGLEAARAAVGRRRANARGAAEVDSAPPLAEALFGGVSREVFAGVSWIGSLVFFGALLGLLFVRRENVRLGLGIVAPLAFVLAASAGVGLVLSSGWIDEGAPGIVLEEGLSLREGPDPRAQERHRAVEGQRAWVLGTERSWMRVRVPGVGQGWVQHDAVGLVRP
ncbi:MAG: hypothetical protein AB8I08_37570 [Sandaracinaceae bacterium]